MPQHQTLGHCRCNDPPPRQGVYDIARRAREPPNGPLPYFLVETLVTSSPERRVCSERSVCDHAAGGQAVRVAWARACVQAGSYSAGVCTQVSRTAPGVRGAQGTGSGLAYYCLPGAKGPCGGASCSQSPSPGARVPVSWPQYAKRSHQCKLHLITGCLQCSCCTVTSLRC